MKIKKFIKNAFSSVVLGLVLSIRPVNAKTVTFQSDSGSSQVITVEKKNFNNMNQDQNKCQKEISFLNEVRRSKKARPHRFRFLSKLKKKKADFPVFAREKKKTNITIPSILGLLISTLIITNTVTIYAQSEKLNRSQLVKIKEFLLKNKKKIFFLLYLLAFVTILYANRGKFTFLVEQIFHHFYSFEDKTNDIIKLLLPKDPVIEELNDQGKISIVKDLRRIREKKLQEIRLKRRKMMLEKLAKEYQDFQKYLQTLKNNRDLLKKFKKKD